MFREKKVKISGAEVYPIIEGGKGIGVSTGATAGAFAAAGAVGTISGVFPPEFENGQMVLKKFKGKTRLKKSQEVAESAIKRTIEEIDIAYKISKGKGRIHLNVLWGVSCAEPVIEAVVNQCQGKLHGIVCGAGMPYKLAEMCATKGIYYYPIVSSARAFKALWSRSYKNYPDFLGGIIYEDPWKAGGHNGLSNKENPLEPESPEGRIKDIRKTLKDVGVGETPIIMAGGVWTLSSYKDWFEDPEIGPIAFQLGTRTLLTEESPISKAWKDRLLTIKKGDIVLNRYSSTGFYSSALKNDFLNELIDRAERQIPFKEEAEGNFIRPVQFQKDKKPVFVTETDKEKAQAWVLDGFDSVMKTPDETLLFVTEAKSKSIRKEQRDCKGCLMACKFSSWAMNPETNYSTGKIADPRSFCIYNTLQNVIIEGDPEKELVFSGHNSYLFSEDPLYKNNHVPKVEELIDVMLTGN